MSDTQTIWMVLWEHATKVAGPFELADVLPEIARTLKVSEQDARRETALLLKELDRLPRGRKYFRVEGNAVAPLPEFQASPKDADTAQARYPFEL
jgi:hypothetical protein